MRKLLRSTRLLACEMASIRIGLGNLEATKGETGNSGNDFTPAAGGTDVSKKEKASPASAKNGPSLLWRLSRTSVTTLEESGGRK